MKPLFSSMILFLLCVTGGSHLPAQASQVATPFEEARSLASPPVRNGFTFAVLGDRTGGPESGLAVLERAVADLNHLDPDLVMTVGDLINGYNAPEEWIAEMERYRAIMSRLKMPWYPAAGNHDVYGPGGSRDDRTNESLYQQHFGPLYYSFDHGNVHFVVLYSDENLSYRNPAQDQRMSQAQLDWLQSDLKTTACSRVFVFLHHPRWNYEGDVWEPVHQALARSDKVEAVFAGHWHRYRDDGVRDGIHYYCLATTGGYSDGLEEAGYFHHYNLVTVRDEDWSMAVVPVGAVRSPDFVSGRESDDVRRLTRGGFLTLVDSFPAPIETGVNAGVQARIENPTEKPLTCDLSWSKMPAVGWRVEPAALVVHLAPGAVELCTFNLQGAPMAAHEPLVPLYLEADLHYPLKGGKEQIIQERCTLDYALPEMPAAVMQDALGEETDRALRLDGVDDCIRVDSTDLLDVDAGFTLECWARLEEPGERSALMTRTQSSSYGIWLTDSGRKGPAFLVYIEPDGYLSPAGGESDLAPGNWTHYAGVFDGEEARLYVNGCCVAAEKGSGEIRGNDLPLIVGADVGWGGRPSAFARGLVDEVRLSRGARYTGSFDPLSRLTADRDTLLLFHFDRVFGDRTPDSSGQGHHGRFLGGARLVEAARKGVD